MAHDTIPVVGIVGGIGSGKSLVATELAHDGGYLIVADRLGHEALRQPDLRDQVVARFGPGILAADGSIDRRQLGARVFADPAERQALEAISLPYIGRRIEEEIERARQQPDVRRVVLDAAIMLETGWDHVCDRIVYVDAPRAVRLERLRERRGWSEEELNRREAAQWLLEEKRRRADAVVTNDGTPEDVARQVRELLAAWNVKP